MGTRSALSVDEAHLLHSAMMLAAHNTVAMWRVAQLPQVQAEASARYLEQAAAAIDRMGMDDYPDDLPPQPALVLRQIAETIQTPPAA